MFDNVTKSIRVLSAGSVEKANSGHPGMPLGMADVGTVLYKNFLKVTNNCPDWINRDRFVLSAGHGSALLYSLLHFNGFDISIDDMKNFRQLNSKTPGHPELDTKLGIDITTGPLGQGFATGVGLALAESYLSNTFGDKIINHFTYGIISDGDLMEGLSQEAAELAALWGLGKLIYIFDDNNISIDGNVDKVSVTNQKTKFESFGWDVQSINGHNENEIIKAVNNAKANTSQPSLIIAKSTIGKFSPNKENTSGVHGSPLGEEEMKQFLENLDWSTDLFEHPKEVYEYFDEKRQIDNKEYKNWKQELEKKLLEDTEFKLLWDQFNEKNIVNINTALSEKKATRVAGSQVLKDIGKFNKFILGGSADLAASTKQIISDAVYSSENQTGQVLEYGVREHAMAAITNGITLHSSLVGFGSTFLVFSDYMRPSIRLAALMELNSVFIFTHDSIYLGEDGPTHQPIEHLMSLRLIPGLEVIRPANNNEILYAYRFAFENKNNPTVIVLSRQDMKYLENNLQYEEFIKGAYEFSPGKDITIFATGSELEIAKEISNLLDDLSIQIISVPILDKLDNETLNLLSPNSEIFTIELGRSVGWDSYIKNIKKSFSINSFGKSAPIKDLVNEFDFAAEKIANEIKNLIN